MRVYYSPCGATGLYLTHKQVTDTVLWFGGGGGRNVIIGESTYNLMRYSVLFVSFLAICIRILVTYIVYCIYITMSAIIIECFNEHDDIKYY